MVPTISGLIVGGFSMGALAMMTGGITGRVAKGEAVGSEMGQVVGKVEILEWIIPQLINMTPHRC